MVIPKLPKRRKTGILKDIKNKRRNYKIIKEIRLRQSTYPEKIFVLQELLFKNGKKEIRIGYYIIGKKGKMKGKWVWGQYCPLFPRKDLEKLIKLAKKEGFIK